MAFETQKFQSFRPQFQSPNCITNLPGVEPSPNSFPETLPSNQVALDLTSWQMPQAKIPVPAAACRLFFPGKPVAYAARIIHPKWITCMECFTPTDSQALVGWCLTTAGCLHDQQKIRSSNLSHCRKEFGRFLRCRSRLNYFKYRLSDSQTFHSRISTTCQIWILE